VCFEYLEKYFKPLIHYIYFKCKNYIILCSSATRAISLYVENMKNISPKWFKIEVSALQFWMTTLRRTWHHCPVWSNWQPKFKCTLEKQVFFLILSVRKYIFNPHSNTYSVHIQGSEFISALAAISCYVIGLEIILNTSLCEYILCLKNIFLFSFYLLETISQTLSSHSFNSRFNLFVESQVGRRWTGIKYIICTVTLLSFDHASRYSCFAQSTVVFCWILRTMSVLYKRKFYSNISCFTAVCVFDL
jgi:hypothetical protein